MGKELGKLIRIQRETVGLSQGEVAHALRLATAQSISNIERGVSPLPPKKIRALSRVLETPPTVFVDTILKEKRAKLCKAAGIK